jgi:hypothetical protein
MSVLRRSPDLKHRRSVTILVRVHRWIMAAEQAINTIYVLAESPDMLCAAILQRVHAFITAPQCTLTAERGLACLVFVVGHIAVWAAARTYTLILSSHSPTTTAQAARASGVYRS